MIAIRPIVNVTAVGIPIPVPAETVLVVVICMPRCTRWLIVPSSSLLFFPSLRADSVTSWAACVGRMAVS